MGYSVDIPFRRRRVADPRQATTTIPSKSPARWLMLALVWLLYASFGLTSGTIPPLVGPIVDDLGMTYSQMGLVLGAWQLVYIGTAFPLGALIDRLGVRRSLGIGIGIVWLSLVLRGMAGDFTTLFGAVALFGVGGPIISIGAPKVVSVWFEGSERGLAAGIYTTGPVTGMALSLATAAGVVMPLTGSWRGVSLVYGVVVLAVVVAWWLFSRDAPTEASDSTTGADGGAEPLRVTLAALLRLRNMRVILVVAVMSFLLNHGLNNWVPTLLSEGGMTISQAGSWTAAATAFSALGLLFIPRLAKQGRRAATLGVLLAVACATTIGLSFLAGPLLIGSLLLSTMVRSPLMPISTLILMETRGIGARRMGAAGGLFFAAAEIGGFGGPFLLGYLRDVSGSLIAGVLILAVVAGLLVLMLPLLRETDVEKVAPETA